MSLSHTRASGLRLILCCFFLFFATHPLLPRAFAAAAWWQLLQSNIGIMAKHMQLLHNDCVVIFDRTDFGKSNLSLPDGKCRHDPTETVIVDDRTAHSVEYDVTSNTFRPLMIQTDVWCSSGAAMPDGSLVQTSGYSDEERPVRIFVSCSNGLCNWREIENGLAARRWYATSQLHLLWSDDLCIRIIQGLSPVLHLPSHPKD